METTTKLISEALFAGGDCDKNIHDFVKGKLESNILIYLTEDSKGLYKCEVTGAIFAKNIFTYGKNRKANEYVMNEVGYHQLLAHLISKKNGRILHLQYIRVSSILIRNFFDKNTDEEADEAYFDMYEIMLGRTIKEIKNYERVLDGRQ